MSTLVVKLKQSAMKGAIVAIAGAGASVVIGNGLESVKVFSMQLPKAVVLGGSLFGTSIAADFLVPYITPFASVGSPALRKFENLVLTPLMVGVGLVLVDSVISPETVASAGNNLIKQVSVGFGASVLAGYTSEGLGWQPTVIG